MPSFAGSASIPALLVASVLLATTAAVAQKAPDDRCSGTLCDLYYGSSKPLPEQQSITAPTPPAAPQRSYLIGGASPAGAPAGAAAPSRVQVQGGGLVGMVKGAPPERCTGTLCDLYYGGPPPEHPEEQPAAAPATAEQAAAEPSPEDEAPPPPRGHHPVEAREIQHCAATGRDPWSCYR